MREQIAVLDGLGYGPQLPHTREVGPVPSNGGNYVGGSNWDEGFPYSPQQEGLAGLGSAGALGMEYTPEPGGGALYEGGSSWHPYTPTLPSSEGLANGSLSIERVPGYAGSTVNPVPGGGANYTGGSDWHPDFPTKIPSEGLVGTRFGRMGYAPSVWRHPMYDPREKVVAQALACGAASMYRMLLGVVYPLEVQRVVETCMRKFRNEGRLEMVIGASRAEIAYLGALYVADRNTAQDGWKGADPRKRARAAAQMCG